MNLIPDKPLFFIVSFETSRYREKKLCADNKKLETIGDVFCPTLRKEKSVHISNEKTSSIYDCEKCKVCYHVLNIPFKDQKPTIMLFGGDGTHCFVWKNERRFATSGKPSPILKKLFCRSQSSTPELEPAKKGKKQSLYGIIVSTPHWLIQLTKKSSTLSVYTNPV